MKSINVFKQIITILIFFFFLKSYSQFTVKISNMKYDNSPISNCERIDFKSSNNHSLSFNVIVEKPYDPLNTNSINDNNIAGDIEIILGALGTLKTKEKTDIDSSNWVIDTANSLMRANIPYNILINNSEININQNNIFAIYESNSQQIKESCKYALTRPKFSNNQDNITISCNNNSPKTFTITNVNSSPGNLSFNWEVGNGWERNGNPVSNFTTTTNSISLTPTAFPPSDVKVTPVLDGVSYPKLTTTVSLSQLTVGEISGNSQSCINSNNTFSISYIPNNANVTWSLTPSNIANIISSNGSSVTINGAFNGVAILKAVVSNSCGQTKTRTKNIQVGGPVISGVSEIDPNSIFQLLPFKPDCLVGLKLNLFPSTAGIINYEWQKISSNFQWTKDFAPNVNNNEIIINTNSNKTISFKVRVQDDLCGWSNWKTINYTITNCGTSNNGGSGNGGINSNNFSIYPVPVSNILHIDIQSLSGPFLLNNGDVYTLKLFKAGVGYVRQITSYTSNAQINVNGLASGLYILEIHYNNIYESHGIIIN